MCMIAEKHFEAMVALLFIYKLNSVGISCSIILVAYCTKKCSKTTTRLWLSKSIASDKVF